MAAGGAEGRLVSLHRFTASRSSWEMHPAGGEVVVCTAGRLTLQQEFEDGPRATLVLEPGDHAIYPPGAWHTADVGGETAALFITCGRGTQLRPRGVPVDTGATTP